MRSRSNMQQLIINYLSQRCTIKRCSCLHNCSEFSLILYRKCSQMSVRKVPSNLKHLLNQKQKKKIPFLHNVTLYIKYQIWEQKYLSMQCNVLYTRKRILVTNPYCFFVVVQCYNEHKKVTKEATLGKPNALSIKSYFLYNQ